MDITFSIAKSATFLEVSKITSLIGAKIPVEGGGNLYDQVAVTADEYHILEGYWREAASKAITTLRRFYRSVTPLGTGSMVDMEEVLILALSMPARFDAQYAPAMESSLFNYFVSYIVSKWLPLAYRADVEYYQKDAADNLTRILTSIFHQNYPERA